MNKTKLTVTISKNTKEDLKKFSIEVGMSFNEIIESLLKDAGIAKRFFTPNRWGEMLAEPTLKEAITPKMEFEEKILIAKHRIATWQKEKADLESFISKTNKIIQEELSKLNDKG